MFVTNAFAQAPATTATTETATLPPDVSPTKMMTDTLLFMAVMFGIFYFLLIRPQSKRIKEHKAMVEALKKGSRVITGGGIVGVVAKVEADGMLQVEIAPSVKVRVTRDSITSVLDGTGPVGETANDN